MSEHHKYYVDEKDDEEYTADRKEVLAILDRFIVRTYGERCPEVEGGCPCCSIWALRDALHAAILEC